jgi:tRNA 2-thiouridine synthesizing protein A
MEPRTSSADTRWDAGELGCGQLILGLRARLARLGAGETIEVVSHDDGAPSDLAAWCRMTGHALVSARHPVYRIRREPEGAHSSSTRESAR